jgi:hypothetical protein
MGGGNEVTRTSLSFLLGAALLATPLAAQTPSSSEIPDFSGFWSLDREQHPFDPELIAKLPPDTVVLDDTGFVEFPQGEYGGLKVKPEALAKAAQWQPEHEMTLERVCAAPSVVYSIQGPFPFEIYQTPELIVFKYEYFDQVRLIFMDGRVPPEDVPHSNVGFSVGRWDDGELVIETTHLLPATITNNGLDHSESLRMVERYKRSADGTKLQATQWFEDPEVLENNGARYIQWTHEPGNYVFPYNCNPTFALEYQAVEDGEGAAP